MTDGSGPGRAPVSPVWGALLTWTWCLPTSLLGWAAGILTILLLDGRRSPFRGATVIRSARLRSLGGVCLGPVILVTDTATPELIQHEWGHFRQHLLLGPFYLLVIGIPSATHAAWHRLRGGQFPEYFHFWTEAWADALGGVYDRHAHVHPHWTGYAVGPLSALVAGILSLRAFGHIVDLPFTDADALADVAWARFPLSQQLFVPLTGGLGGDNANFWRPAAMVQFWALRHLFGEEAWAWHAWSLLLHVAASVLVGLWVEAMLLLLEPGRGRPWFPVLVAGLFAAHPLAEEIVPATARNLDLLLGVGFFGAMGCYARTLAADRAGLRSPIASVLFWGFAALAILSKEAGVLLLPVCGAWAWRYGTRRSGLRLVPVVGLVVAFLGVRSQVLGGVGGYLALDGGNVSTGLLYAIKRAFLEPLIAPSSVGFGPFEGVWWALVGMLLLASVLLVRREWLFTLAALYLPWVLLLGATHTYSRRVLYVPSAAMCVLLAFFLVEAVRARRGVFFALGLGGLYVYGSPAVVRYDDWAALGRAAAPFLDPALWTGIPAGSTVWLVDRPTRVDDDPRRFRLWSDRKSLNNAATSYAIEAWVDEHVADLTVEPLTSIVMDTPLSAWQAEIVASPDHVEVRRPPTTRAVHPSSVRVVEGPELRVDRGAWLVVWNPDGAVRIGE